MTKVLDRESMGMILISEANGRVGVMRTASLSQFIVKGGSPFSITQVTWARMPTDSP